MTSGALLGPGAAGPAPDLSAVRLWLRSCAEQIELVLVCAEHPRPDSVAAAVGGSRPDAVVVRVPGCLAVVRPGDLVHLLADGAAGVRLWGDGCDHEPLIRRRLGDVMALLHDRGRAVAAGEAGPGSPLLEIWSAPPPVADAERRRVAVPVLEGGNMPVSRRTLVGGPVDPLPRPAATEHGDLLAALAAVREATDERVPDPAAAVAIPGPGLMLAAPGCVACGTCVRSCPERALDLQVDDRGTAALVEDIGACSGCRQCIESCPPGVLTVRRQARWSDQLRGGTLPLAHLAVTKCARCTTSIPADGDELCSVCAYRRRHPFGSVLPPQSAL